MGTLASMLKSNAWRRSGIGFTSSIANRLIWSLKPPKRKGFSKRHSSLHAQFYSKTRRPKSEKTQVNNSWTNEICQGLSFSKSATFWVLNSPNQKSHAIGHWHIVRKRTFTTRDERKPRRSRLPTDERKSQMISQRIPAMVEPINLRFQTKYGWNLASQKSSHVSTSRVSKRFVTFLARFFLKVSRTSWRLCRLPERVREPAGQKSWHCFGIGVKKSGLILTTWNPRNICLCAAFQWL